MKRIFVTSVISVLGFILFTVMPVSAQKGVGDATGIAREVEKPAIESFEGVLEQIKTGPCEHTTGHAYIGTHLFLKTGNSNQILNIHLGAAYALESYVKGLEAGQIIEVQAFRTDAMEQGQYIAKEITANGQVLQLRNENLRPFWAGDKNVQRTGRPGHRGYRW
ncbi:MAG: hypothetical protein U5K72_03535 [Balneolaceae bacterium]|nr:hypothetical protein [Balneolaceae bacterium]